MLFPSCISFKNNRLVSLDVIFPYAPPLIFNPSLPLQVIIAQFLMR